MERSASKEVPRAASPTKETTLYPKITNHIHEVVKTLKYRLGQTVDNPTEVLHLDPIPIVGTVKLHGTHADILVHHDTDKIVLQSRNNVNLLPRADNHDFAKSMTQKTSTILFLRDQYIARWKELNPTMELDTSIPLTIAGEWIGQKIQKGVALAHLSKRLVIISVKINGKWVNDEQYSDIEAPDNQIYNISRASFYRAILYPEDQVRTIADLEPLAEKIAARCPFAESFGVEGEGEGLVWKLVPYIDNSEFWFKTKGGRFKPTFTPAHKKPAGDDSGKREVAVTVAKAWCSEQRMEQGWDYLRERGLPQSMKGIGTYLKWVQNDILIEEKGYIEENKVDEAMLRTETIAIAKPWFFRRMKKGDE
ncbi:hypothetical protein BDV96DRAFT_562015 [Lophiotrema nucula]|uniref:RNA ligase domain-containing protein n=1 Tax=Lophiotrema nucula TaxID=690887 RepID=A0A6A5ZW76_9PLEO|nr:hypothetical protein BDV96DRAFT_562015 [Lophiotrema nucula]